MTAKQLEINEKENENQMAKAKNNELEADIEELKTAKDNMESSKNDEIARKEKEIELMKTLQKNIQERFKKMQKENENEMA